MKRWEYFSKEELQKMADESISYRELAFKIGYNGDGGGSISTIKEMIEELNLNISHFKGQGWNKNLTKEDTPSLEKKEHYNMEDIFVSNSPVRRRVIRNYILRHNLIEYKCAFCGNTGIWIDTTIALELDHINGINNDNRLTNLRWLCPNCHATTDTYRGKNIKKKNEEEKIKRKIKEIPKKICPICQINEINSHSKMCKECNYKQQRKAERPSREELKDLIRNKSFLEIGRIFNVSDNAIRKWCDFENLPRKKTEINKYSDEEWALI